MEQKLFGLDLATDGLEVVSRGGRFYVRYDVGAHQVAWREDEISEEEALKIKSGKVGENEVLTSLQRRLGLDAYKSNWAPPT